MRKYGSVEMQVYHTIEQIDRAGWEGIRDQRQLLTDLNYLHAIEESGAIEGEHRYFEFSAGDSLICTMFGFVLMNDVVQIGGGNLEKVVFAIRRVVPNFLKYKTLEIGSPISIGLTVSTIPQVTKGQILAAVELLIAYVKSERIKLLLFRDFGGEKRLIEQVLLEAGFIDLLNLPAAKMQIVWDSFEEYLAKLKKRYRSEARRKLQHKDRHGVRVVFCNDQRSLERIQDYVRLYQETMARSKEFPREFIGERYHRAMSKYLKDQSYWLEYFKDDQLVAFSHFIVYEGTLTGHYIGLDYQASREAMLYFNFYYDTIEFAIRNGIGSVEAGVTTYEAKSTAGFSIFPLRMYLWHQNAVFKRFVQRLYSAFTDFELQNCHYVFKGEKHQYLWDGVDKYTPDFG